MSAHGPIFRVHDLLHNIFFPFFKFVMISTPKQLALCLFIATMYLTNAYIIGFILTLTRLSSTSRRAAGSRTSQSRLHICSGKRSSSLSLQSTWQSPTLESQQTLQGFSIHGHLDQLSMAVY